MGTVGNHADFAYWGPAATAAGVNKKSVNWDAYNTIASTNGGVRDALDCYCTGNNWCYVAAHSAGNLQVGYALSLYGLHYAPRKRTCPTAPAYAAALAPARKPAGISWLTWPAVQAVDSELANAGSWALSEPLVGDLKNGDGTRCTTTTMH